MSGGIGFGKHHFFEQGQEFIRNWCQSRDFSCPTDPPILTVVDQQGHYWFKKDDLNRFLHIQHPKNAEWAMKLLFSEWSPNDLDLEVVSYEDLGLCTVCSDIDRDTQFYPETGYFLMSFISELQQEEIFRDPDHYIGHSAYDPDDSSDDSSDDDYEDPFITTFTDKRGIVWFNFFELKRCFGLRRISYVMEKYTNGSLKIQNFNSCSYVNELHALVMYFLDSLQKKTFLKSCYM